MKEFKNLSEKNGTCTFQPPPPLYNFFIAWLPILITVLRVIFAQFLFSHPSIFENGFPRLELAQTQN